jgi:hypothetical protein
MKVGLKIGPATDSHVKDAAVRAEEMGFDSLWLSERVAIPLDKPHPYEAGTDPWIGLAFVAAVTTASSFRNQREPHRAPPSGTDGPRAGDTR